MDGQAGAQRQRVQVLERGLAQAGPLQGDTAKLEQLEPDPVAAAVPLQPAHRAQLIRQPVQGRLGQADPVTDLAQAQGRSQPSNEARIASSRPTTVLACASSSRPATAFRVGRTLPRWTADGPTRC